MAKHADGRKVGIASRRVFTRDEFVAELMARVEDVTDIGPIMKFVETVLRLQNDMGRPVYIFEVDDDITTEDIELIDDTMRSLGVACCLLPKRRIGYVGEVDGRSFGVKSMQAELLGLVEGVVDYGQNDGFRTDDSGA